MMTPHRGGVFPYTSYISMCGPKGYGFSAVLVINRKLDTFIYSYSYSFFISVKSKDKEKVYYMSLQTEVTKGFLVSLQLFCFYGVLIKRKKLLREWDIKLEIPPPPPPPGGEILVILLCLA